MKHVVRIRAIDKIIFDSIKNGSKSIETRAATEKHKKIAKGDKIVFVCGDEKIEKLVKEAIHYKTIEEMTSKIDFKDVMPFVESVDEMKKVYFNFPNYKEKIEEFGLVAFELE